MAQTRAHTPEEQALLDCMIQSWYATFKDVTFRSVLLPLPQEFLDWLVSDGLYLPEDSEAVRRGRGGTCAARRSPHVGGAARVWLP